MRTFRMLPVLAVAAAACTVEGTSPGELGNGSFTYGCAGPTDAWCETPFRHGGTPRVGLASAFGASYGDNEPGSVLVESASPSRLLQSRGRWAFRSPGAVALLARGTDGTVRDFLHLYAEPIVSVDLVQVEGQLLGAAPDQRLGGDPWALRPVHALVIRPSERPTLFGYPVAADGEVLAGSATWSFDVQPAGIVALHFVAGDNVVEIEPLAAGNARLTARVGDTLRTVDLHVEVGP